jgi:hypothetical protein
MGLRRKSDEQDGILLTRPDNQRKERGNGLMDR